jgi:two-component sensor histidine kinase
MTPIGEDATERRRQEELMAKALKEKELLLHEVHHRVKNNLQLISSLLSLQEEEASPDATRILKDAQNRIRSLSLAHERLYSAKDLSSIDLGEYATQIVTALLSGCEADAIAFEPDFAPLPVTLDEAIPCGLIINEAVTNALKHAFPAEWAGPRRIAVRIGVAKEGRRFIEIRDSGAGIPPGTRSGSERGIGITIMRLLSSQLGGDLSITSEDGARIVVSF